MTHRAGGEFHGPLGHASSDLSEIASRKQNFWGIFEGPDVSKRIHFRPKTFVCSLLDSEAFWATSEVADTVAYGSMHYLNPLSEPKPNGTSRLEIEAVDQTCPEQGLQERQWETNPGPRSPPGMEMSGNGREMTSEH